MKNTLTTGLLAMGLLFFSLTAGADASAPNPAQSPVPTTQPVPSANVSAVAPGVNACGNGCASDFPTYAIMGIVVVLLFGSLSGVRGSLAAGKWDLAHALSENVEAQPASGAVAPGDASHTPLLPGSSTVLVGSTSRLIAFMGMLVILVFFVGTGLWLLWYLLRTGTVPANLDKLLNFFAGGAVLFAPYALNQLRSAFKIGG